MQTTPTTPNRVDLFYRLSGLFILGPALAIIAAYLILPKDQVIPSAGWLFILLGIAFLAFTTVRNFLITLRARPSHILFTETDMGLIAIGLALVAPSMWLTYYFYYLVILSAAMVLGRIFVDGRRVK